MCTNHRVASGFRCQLTTKREASQKLVSLFLYSDPNNNDFDDHAA